MDVYVHPVAVSAVGVNIPRVDELGRAGHVDGVRRVGRFKAGHEVRLARSANIKAKRSARHRDRRLHSICVAVSELEIVAEHYCSIRLLVERTRVEAGERLGVAVPAEYQLSVEHRFAACHADTSVHIVAASRHAAVLLADHGPSDEQVLSARDFEDGALLRSLVRRPRADLRTGGVDLRAERIDAAVNAERTLDDRERTEALGRCVAVRVEDELLGEHRVREDSRATGKARRAEKVSRTVATGDRKRPRTCLDEAAIGLVPHARKGSIALRVEHASRSRGSLE